VSLFTGKTLVFTLDYFSEKIFHSSYHIHFPFALIMEAQYCCQNISDSYITESLPPLVALCGLKPKITITQSKKVLQNLQHAEERCSFPHKEKEITKLRSLSLTYMQS